MYLNILNFTRTFKYKYLCHKGSDIAVDSLIASSTFCGPQLTGRAPAEALRTVGSPHPLSCCHLRLAVKVKSVMSDSL